MQPEVHPIHLPLPFRIVDACSRARRVKKKIYFAVWKLVWDVYDGDIAFYGIIGSFEIALRIADSFFKILRAWSFAEVSDGDIYRFIEFIVFDVFRKVRWQFARVQRINEMHFKFF